MITIKSATEYLPPLLRVRARSPRDVATVHTAMCAKKKVTAWNTVEPVPAYVNHGRWVADCVVCRAGLMLIEGHNEGWCAGCGAVYSSVIWPDTDLLKQVLQELQKRPAAAVQNWRPGETIQQLQLDNVLHRVI